MHSTSTRLPGLSISRSAKKFHREYDNPHTCIIFNKQSTGLARKKACPNCNLHIKCVAMGT